MGCLYLAHERALVNGRARFAWLGLLLGIAGPAAAERVLLEDVHLDGVTAGQPTYSPQQSPGTGEVVVVDTRFAVVDRSSVVSLSGPVQALSATANLVNAARADVANGINVLSGRNPQLIGTQTNTVSQAESRIGYLGSSSLLGKNIQTAFSHTASNSSFSRSSISFQHIDTTSTHTETSSTFMANVPKYNPLADLTLPLGSFTRKTVEAPK